MYRWLKIILLIYSLSLLQGCILLYFFAPKVTPEELPGSAEELVEVKQVYIEQCSRCHLLIAPSYFRYNATIESILERYRKQHILTPLEAIQIKIYINAVLMDGD